MNTKRMLFIINPCAGQRRVARKLPTILQRFCAGGMVPTVLTTEYAGHAASSFSNTPGSMTSWSARAATAR